MSFRIQMAYKCKDRNSAIWINLSVLRAKFPAVQPNKKIVKIVKFYWRHGEIILTKYNPI